MELASEFKRSPRFAGATAQCRRPSMQDCFTYNVGLNKRYYFILCDGHGTTELAAKFVMNSFSIRLKTIDDIKSSLLSIKTDLCRWCKEIDEELKQYMSDNNIKSAGTTLIIAYLSRYGLITLNVGDSLILINNNENIIFRNVFHTPSNSIERNRILKTSLIMNNRIDNVINVSRTFGDFEFKKYLHDYNPIIVDPDIYHIPHKTIFNNSNSWCLMASDGIYLTLYQNRLDYILQTSINYFFRVGYNADYIINTFINFSARLDVQDNVTAFLIVFTEPPLDYKEKERFFVLKKLLILDMNVWLEEMTGHLPLKKDKIIFAERKYDLFLERQKPLTNDEKLIFKFLQFEIIDECFINMDD